MAIPERLFQALLAPVLALAIPCGQAGAASFDCAKAGTPLEKAICANPKLSALDDELAGAYRAALTRLGEPGAAILRSGQRRWLKELGQRRGQSNGKFVDNDYQERIAELKDIPDYPRPEAPAPGPELRSAALLPGFELTLRAAAPCTTGAEAPLAVPAQLLVRAKGQTAPLQAINLPGARGLCGGSTLDDLATVADYNFDGLPDLSIGNEEETGYGGAGQTMFLADPAGRGLVFNPGLTDLANTSNSFAADPATKLIETMSKSGAFYHRTTLYRMAGDKPVIVSETIEDFSPVDGERVRKVTESKWVKGEWKTVVRVERPD
ncbi:MAG: lysozyme inhibitor LprI family protein [Rhodospirillaceae bacterium]